MAIALVPERDDLRCGADTGIRLLTDDVHATRERCRLRGAAVGPVGGCAAAPPTFVLRDPDDNQLMIVERTSR